MKMINYWSKGDDAAVPDGCVKSLYDLMEEQGTAKIVFEDGTINDRDGFLNAMKTGCRLHIILDDNEPVAVVWLNRFEGKMARLHFCLFRNAWGEKSERVGRFAVTEILNMRFDGETLYDCLVGYIPDKNKAARMFFQKIGVKTVGHLPMGHWNAEEGKMEPCTIVYMDRGCL